MKIAMLVGTVTLALAGCSVGGGSGAAEDLWDTLSTAFGGEDVLCFSWQGTQFVDSNERQEFIDSMAMMRYGAPSNVGSEEEFAAFAVEFEETFKRHCE